MTTLIVYIRSTGSYHTEFLEWARNNGIPMMGVGFDPQYRYRGSKFLLEHYRTNYKTNDIYLVSSRMMIRATDYALVALRHHSIEIVE